MSAVALPNHIPSAQLASYPVRGGNALRALVDGDRAFRRICEAADQARHSVWVTVAFLYPDFRMPDGRSFFDVLDQAAGRGVDVRALFWRTKSEEAGHFHGHAEDHGFLTKRGARFLARWDRAEKNYCQHQKSWLIDAGHESEIAFVGGINLDNPSVSASGHADRDGEHTHDVYLELRGPCATDVHHNFVQRWNEASERHLDGGLWAHAREHVLPFPARLSPAAGNAIVQMQRSIRAGRYSDSTATPDGAPFEIATGEHSIFEQYASAITAARHAIYIEDQYIASPDIVEALHSALKRGVDVTFLAPADPEPQVKAARKRPEATPFFARVAALGEYPNFLLAGIASPRTGAPVYVHDKIMLVDDCWATIGSCNIASQSFFCDSELNASIWDEVFVRTVRAELLKEHLGEDTTHLSVRAAMKRYRDVAHANAEARAGGKRMTALAFALDPAKYAL